MKPFQLPGRVCKLSGAVVRDPKTRRFRVFRVGELAAADVGCLKTFRSFQQIEFDGFALVQSAIPVFLDGGEVNENIFTCGPLDKTISFCPVEPLYCTLLSHKSTPFASIDLLSALREAWRLNIPPQRAGAVTSGKCFAAASQPNKQKALHHPRKRFPGQLRANEAAGFDDVTQNINPNSFLLP